MGRRHGDPVLPRPLSVYIVEGVTQESGLLAASTGGSAGGNDKVDTANTWSTLFHPLMTTTSLQARGQSLHSNHPYSSTLTLLHVVVG